MVYTKKVSKRVREKDIRDALAKRLGGETEWVSPAGFLDIITNSEVIEIQHHIDWKSGLGQVSSYGAFYPTHKKRLHLFAQKGEEASKYFKIASFVGAKSGVHVTFEEVSPGDNKGASVLYDTDAVGISMTVVTGPRMKTG